MESKKPEYTDMFWVSFQKEVKTEDDGYLIIIVTAEYILGETKMRKILYCFTLLPFIFLFCSCSMENDGGAIVLAENIVSNKLVSPTTAKYSDKKVIERKNNLFLVQLTVDAQNVYGAIIRNYYLVVLEIEGGQYYYSRSDAAQCYQQIPTAGDIDFTKTINNWDNWNYNPKK